MMNAAAINEAKESILIVKGTVNPVITCFLLSVLQEPLILGSFIKTC